MPERTDPWAPLCQGAALAQFVVCALALTLACTGPHAPGARDAFDDLLQATDAARLVLPLASATCLLLPEELDRARCSAAIVEVRADADEADAVLSRVAACRESLDAACLEGFAADARRLLPRLRRIAGGKAPAPAGSAP